jgi:hypothetical protein
MCQHKYFPSIYQTKYILDVQKVPKIGFLLGRVRLFPMNIVLQYTFVCYFNILYVEQFFRENYFKLS